MKYIKLNAFDCPDAWYKAVQAIWESGDDFYVCYGSERAKTRKLNLSIEISKPETRPLVDDKAPCDMKYVQWYALRYLWSGVVEKETYTYGSRLRRPIDQIETAIQRYLEEPADRQITLAVRSPEDILKDVDGRKHEPPCLTLIDTEILHGQLHLTCYFRSWDAFAGLPANVAGIQLFNEAFVAELRKRGAIDITTGKLIFHSKNCHIYDRQSKIVQELLEPKTKNRKRNFEAS